MLTLGAPTRKGPTAASAGDDPARHWRTHSKSPPQATTPASSALSTPSSPHMSHRAAIRSLTLPTKPNLDIPQSPSGSPTLGADQKFSHFLNLKKQGIHFNTKLGSSSALKNPSLLPKLMDFAGVDSEWQYTTTLSTELWDPAGLPTWGYKEELAEAQRRLSKRKEEEGVRESITFVAAGTPRQSSGLTVGKATKASAAERVMAFLDKEETSLSQPNIAGVRHEAERTGRTINGLQGRRKSESPRSRKPSRSR